jgi:hypothetical protein
MTNIFKDKNISVADQKKYRQLIKDGLIDEAIADFYDKYVIDNINKYNNQMSEYMRQARLDMMSATEKNSLITEISIISGILAALTARQYKQFVEVQGSVILTGIKSKRVQNEIMRSATDEFERLIKDAMTRTRENVLYNVRQIQRGFVTEQARLRGMGLKGIELDKAINKFKTEIKKRFPDYMELEANKNFLKTRLAKDGAVRNLRLDKYTEMSINTALMNVDRTATEVEATIENDIVVEYYLEVRRQVKTTERQICQRIMSNKIMGKSLLAMNETIARALNIMTIAQAKSTPDYAMGYHCRHSIRRVSSEFTRGLIAEYNIRQAA